MALTDIRTSWPQEQSCNTHNELQCSSAARQDWKQMVSPRIPQTPETEFIGRLKGNLHTDNEYADSIPQGLSSEEITKSKSPPTN